MARSLPQMVFANQRSSRLTQLLLAVCDFGLNSCAEVGGSPIILCLSSDRRISVLSKIKPQRKADDTNCYK